MRALALVAAALSVAVAARTTAAQPTSALPSSSAYAAALDSVVRAHAHPLRLDGGRLTGSGADSLVAAATRAEFVLVAEQHYTAEVPRLVAALMRRLRPAGYRYLALEVSPADATRLADLARTGDPGRALARTRAAEGTVVPFYSEYAEDAGLLSVVATDSVALWGLDQAYLGSTPGPLARLVALAPTPAAKALAEGYRARDVAAGRADTGSAGAAGRFLDWASDADFRALRDAFRAAPPEAGRVLDELEESAAIYRANAAGSPAANLVRSRLMKRHLQAYYDAAVRAGDARPRAVFKFGAVHMRRGLSVLGVYDLGNAALELAELHGGTSLHVGLFELAPDDPLRAALRAVPEGSWAVLDLRPLRPVVERAERSGARPDPALAARVQGYDVLVVAPRLTRSAPVARE